MLHEYFGISPDFQWPKAERNLGKRLDTTGPVYRDMDVVKALDKYPQHLTSLWTDDGVVCPSLFRKPHRIMRYVFVFWRSQTRRQWKSDRVCRGAAAAGAVGRWWGGREIEASVHFLLA